METFLDGLRALLGARHVLTEGTEAYAADWRRRFVGQPLAVARPADTAEVASVMQLCLRHDVAVVPQGGNTGMCGGAIPDASGRQLVLSLSRLNQVREVDALNNTMTLGAGCVLVQAQEAAAAQDRLFPLSLGAEGSCQIGGNIATNAGGIQVLRYGNARDLVLGLEVVLADGRVLDLMRALRKDNAGYDLKHLFIGSEGTLGIITAAVVKLFPRPRSQATAFAALASPAEAVRLLGMLRGRLGDRFTAFELIGSAAVDLVARYYPERPPPLAGSAPWFVLMEARDGGSQEALDDVFQAALAQALDDGLVNDVVVCASQSQTQVLWAMRELIPEAQQQDGGNIKHDISVAVSRIPAFIDETVRQLHAAYPGVRPIIFGHLGDGNLHYNVSCPAGAAASAWQQDEADRVNHIVLDEVARCHGSFSAEHGLGQAKAHELARYRSPLALETMRGLKTLFDPRGLLNPGKVLMRP